MPEYMQLGRVQTARSRERMACAIVALAVTKIGWNKIGWNKEVCVQRAVGRLCK